jgi:predicted transcriptional regulator
MGSDPNQLLHTPPCVRIVGMDIGQAAAYWKGRLEEGKPIYRVRVRRLLELAGSERRGYVIVQKIRKVLDAHGLVTIPDFELAWIDNLVRIRLASEGDAQDSLEPNLDRVVGEQESSHEPIVDPAISDQSQLPLATDAVAEPLNAPPETATTDATDSAVSSSVDPIVRVASLAAANRGVVSVSTSDKLDKATTLMLFENYSQLAVMQGARDVKGMISWESIARRSMQSSPPSIVQDCMIEATIVNATDALFDTLREVEQHGYVLVKDKGKITGILTATDFATELASMTQAFISIGTIERLIRNRLHPCLAEADFSNLEQHSRALAEKDFARLTFGENLRLMERPEIWSRLKVSVDKAEFTRRLSVITEIRNDVMHFGPDPLSASQTKNLQQMESLLRQIFYR